MKLLKDYAEDELVAITPDDKQQLFLIECAERGTPLPASVPAFMSSPEDREDLKSDTTVYKVGDYASSMYFNTIEEAQAVADLINRTAVKLDYDYRSHGSNIYHLSDDTGRTVEVETMLVYSADKYKELKNEIDRFARDKEIVDKNNSRRESILNDHASIMGEIDDAIYEAHKNITCLNEFKQIFEQYLTMANGDRDVAVRFLLNAHYSEITEYNGDQLAKIGLTQLDVDGYNEASKPKETE